MRRGSFAAALATLLTLAASAGVVSETISLVPGWNALYIESTPAEDGAAAAEAFFADLPVTKASCYVSSVHSATAQLAADGQAISQKPVSHYIWDASSPSGSTMREIAGGHVYLMFATNAATKTFLGVPQIPRVSWQVSQDGFATFAPVSIPPGEEVAASVYFGGAPCGAACAARPYTVCGQDEAAPTIAQAALFTRKPKVAGGRAYAFESEKAGDWPGVLDVRTGLGEGLAFADGIATESFTVRNASATNREIRVSLVDSARSGDERPALYLYGRIAAGPAHWYAFEATNVVLSAGETRTFTLRCDKSSMAGGASRAGVMVVEDLGGSKMRIRFPVTASADAYAPGEAAFPAGLWVGSAKITQVADKAGRLMAVGRPLQATMLVHVDGDGALALLQRVAVAQEAAGDGTYRATLYKELGDVPEGVAARRMSSVFIDTANRSVGAVANADSSPPEFGRQASFAFTVGERSKENPFRHAWHPDHDGRRADFSGDAPSGDDPANFIGPVKPEAFSVANRLVLTWADDNGRPTYSAAPMDQTTFGRIDWQLEGLRNEPLKLRGLFVLKRVCSASAIK